MNQLIMGQRQTHHAHTPDNVGPTPGECVCAIRRYYNDSPLAGYPENVNIAAAISYKVDVQTPNGIVTFDRVIPAGKRPNAPWLIEAIQGDATLTNGKPALYAGSMMDGAFYLHVQERLYAAPCQPTGGLF